MANEIPGWADDKLPPQAKQRFFCKFHQDDLAVLCEKKLNCKTCGWNPAIERRRKQIIKERMMQK